MDNAGENLHFQHELNKDPVLRFMGTTVEYTAPYTPRQNGKVEHTSPSIFTRTRANFNSANLTYLQEKYYGLKVPNVPSNSTISL